MVETPAAVQIINELCLEGISFISFGTNDLTQYILAIDRNNSEVQYIYDEMNPAVLSALSYVIRRCKRYGVETSVCGQSGSREDMVRFLVSEGIDSISVNADAAEKISKLVAELESGKKSAQNIEKVDLKEVASAEMNMQSSVAIQVPMAPKEKNEELQPSQRTDIESAPIPQQEVVKELLGEIAKESIENSGEEEGYMPGEKKKGEDTPQLNDAIHIDSSLFEGNEESESEFNLEKELKRL